MSQYVTDILESEKKARKIVRSAQKKYQEALDAAKKERIDILTKEYYEYEQACSQRKKDALQQAKIRYKTKKEEYGEKAEKHAFLRELINNDIDDIFQVILSEIRNSSI